MIKTAVEDKICEKMNKHLRTHGLDCTIIPDGTLDFEFDYPRVSLDGPVEGMTSRGVMKVNNSPIDFLDILKRKTLSRSGMAPGGTFGMGVSEGTTWKIRFFLSFTPTTKIGPLKIGTLTKILKGRFSTKVEDFIWNGYGKLTTLPPGMIRDDVIAVLNQDNELKKLMKEKLIKEKIITIGVYRPKTKVEYEHLEYVRDDSLWYKFKPKKESYAKIVITSDWKSQKDIFIDKNTIKMYQRIAEHLKKVVDTLKYHLDKSD